MSWEDYWHGATWCYHATITNDGSNSGNHVYVVVPGVGNEMEILYGEITQGDAAGRVAFVRIDAGAGTSVMGRLIRSATIGAGLIRSYPNGGGGSADDDSIGAGARLIVSGAMRIVAQVAAIAVSENTAFALVARVRNGPGTVTLTSPTDAVEVVQTDGMF